MSEQIVGIIGLGYVGLPLSIEFGKKINTIGYDISENKIAQFKSGQDVTGQINTLAFREAKHLQFTSDENDLTEANVYIVCVPTPINKGNVPDLSILECAATTVGKFLSKGDTVVFESTVYPGATEEICIPALERASKLRWKQDFNVGYSPERINPGDTERTLPHIKKVVSGDTDETLEMLSTLYGSIITAGIFKARSIKVAEAAKAIENTQRDLNIALMNELSVIFSKMDINTKDVLETAATKWNFIKYEPGLVGGHCIGVDPYYLTYKAQTIGYQPEVILAGRRINDSMANFIAEKTVKLMIKKHHRVRNAKVLILGGTFKENCSDIRNSKVFDLISALKDFGCYVYLHDPIASEKEIKDEYGVELTSWESLPEKVEALILAVPHRAYLEMALDQLSTFLIDDGIFIDVKSKVSQEDVTKNISLYQL